MKNISLSTETIQGYDAPPHSFDLVAAIATINHLNEDACIRLHKDEKAVRTYQELFKKIFAPLKFGGSLMITDCSRENAFSWLSDKLGIPNPNAPKTAWLKHQTPQLWVKILESVGFEHATWRWIFPTRRLSLTCSCGLISRLLDNFLLLYLTTSYFAIKAFRTN